MDETLNGEELIVLDDEPSGPEVDTNPEPGLDKERGSSPTSRPTSGANASATSRPTSGSNQGTQSRPLSAKSSEGNSEYDQVFVNPSHEDDTIQLVETNEKTNVVIKDDDDEYIETPPKGCWHVFTQCLCSFWLTREIKPRADQNFYIRTTLRELVLYVIFLILLYFLTFGVTNATMFYYTQIIMGMFANQTTNVNTVKDFWDFMENDLLDGLYWTDTSDDGSQKNYLCPSGNETAGRCLVSSQDKIILYGNFMIGVPRLRQLRVTNDSCVIHPIMQKYLKSNACYDHYSQSTEDTKPFGLAENFYDPDVNFVTSIDAWTYNSSTVLNGTAYTGVFASYSGAGSIQDLDSVQDLSSAIIQELQEGLWIGRGTRFVSLDVTLYNPSLNLFCIIKMVFEFLEVGGVFPSASYSTVKLMPYVTSYDYSIMACQMVFVAFVFYYIVEEGIEIGKQRMSYFTSIFNIMDIVVLVISVVAIFIQVYLIFLTDSSINAMLANPNSFADFTNLQTWSSTNNNVVAVLVLMAWMKVFKYITFNRTITQLKMTLDRCKDELAGFFLMFLIVFFAFDLLAFVWFEAQARSYNSFVETTFTLMRIILADFDFRQLVIADSFLGPLFFFVYVFSVFIILVNVFLAIVNDTYHWVYIELLEQQVKYKVGDYFKDGYSNVMDRVLARERQLAIEEAVNMAAADGIITYEEIRQNLKKCNFSEVEIEVFFARFDVDGKFVYNPEEQEKEDEKHQNFTEEPSSVKFSNVLGPISKEFLGISKRVDNIEHAVSAIIPKLDLLLAKLMNVETGNEKKKATMAKVLGVITEDDGLDDESKRRQVEDLMRAERVSNNNN